jgi:hypothetical protein
VNHDSRLLPYLNCIIFRKEGTLRLVNEKNEVTPFKGGRLEVFINEKWGID